MGHYEDNLICTILDPRFKLMNFNGATSEMKTNAELYLRGNFKADWAPIRKANEDVAIVGAGDTACEEALYLANICSKVYMIVRKDKLSASTIMQNRVLNNPKIEILFNYETKGINGTDEVCSVDLLSNKVDMIKINALKTESCGDTPSSTELEHRLNALLNRNENK